MQHLSSKKNETGQKPHQLVEKKALYSSSYRGLLLQEHQTIGNHGLLRRKTGVIQPKLKIGAPNDKYEQEADRVADKVMRMPEPQLEDEELLQTKPISEQITPLVQRQLEDELEDDEEELIQTKPAVRQLSPLVKRQVEEEKEEIVQTKPEEGKNTFATHDVEGHIRSMRGNGQPLPKSVRAFFEPRFGHDLSRVKIHRDGNAVATTSLLNAKAFTVGNSIFLGAGHHSLNTTEAKHLLAHELTHVVQQTKTNAIHESNPMGNRYGPINATNCVSTEFPRHDLKSGKTEIKDRFHNQAREKSPELSTVGKRILQRKLLLMRAGTSNVSSFFGRYGFTAYSLHQKGQNILEVRPTRGRPGPSKIEQEILWSLMNSQSSTFRASLGQLGKHIESIKTVANSAWTLVKKGSPKSGFASPKYPEFGSLQKKIKKKGGIRFHWLHWRVVEEYIQLRSPRQVIMDIVVESRGAPSAAIEDIWKNPKEYGYECLTSVRLLALRGYLRKVGKKKFDQRFSRGITFRFSKRSEASAKSLKPGLKKLGLKTVDLGGWDKTDELMPGDLCFLAFTNKHHRLLGDGQNMMYVGGGKYYSHPLGITSLRNIQAYWGIQGKPYQRLSRYVERWKI